MREAYVDAVRVIFDATHNQVWSLLAKPLSNLREMRNWESGTLTADDVVELESAYWDTLLSAIETRDPDHVRIKIARLMQLPHEAEEAMRSTPVGETVEIPIPFPRT
jgi:DNA-binding FadR family transcriptional regulator